MNFLASTGQTTMMTTSTETTNTFASIATTTETLSTAKDYSTSPSTPGKYHNNARGI